MAFAVVAVAVVCVGAVGVFALVTVEHRLYRRVDVGVAVWRVVVWVWVVVVGGGLIGCRRGGR